MDGSELARRIFTLQAWSVQPCVRPLSAVHMTAGHNALRGSGPGQKDAFDDALRGANSFGLAWQACLQQPIAHTFRIRLLSVMKCFYVTFDGKGRLPLQHLPSMGVGGNAVPELR